MRGSFGTWVKRDSYTSLYILLFCILEVTRKYDLVNGKCSWKRCTLSWRLHMAFRKFL